MRFVLFVWHLEDLAQLRWSRRDAAAIGGHQVVDAALLHESVVVTQLLEVGMLECLGGCKSVVMVIGQQFDDDISCLRVLRK